LLKRKKNIIVDPSLVGSFRYLASVVAAAAAAAIVVVEV